jgi:hypothetical protein
MSRGFQLRVLAERQLPFSKQLKAQVKEGRERILALLDCQPKKDQFPTGYRKRD